MPDEPVHTVEQLEPPVWSDAGRPAGAAEAGLPAVPGYVLTRFVARGGMGAVYAARDPALDREVAIKLMHPGMDGRQFVVESKVTAQLPHPGVPPVHALGAAADGRPFLAMKLIGGRTLADELTDRPDPARLLGAFDDVCQTIAFAHERGVVHRDLKPQNVMVGAFGETLVMDWGLAKVIGAVDDAPAARADIADVAATVAGQVKGTPAYMAPEQARGEPIDARADVFALGGILAALLTGRPPFIGETVMDTVIKAAQADLGECFARLDGSDAPPGLVWLCKWCLAATPADRPPDAGAVAAALREYRADQDAALRQAEAAGRVMRARNEETLVAHRRLFRRTLTTFVVMAALAVGAGFVFWDTNRAALEDGLRDGKRRLAAKQQTADLDASEARVIRADAEARLDRAKDAQQDVARRTREAMAESLKARNALATVADALHKAGQTDAAVAVCEEGLRLYPKDNVMGNRLWQIKIAVAKEAKGRGRLPLAPPPRPVTRP